jgi:hypothetical protein
LKRRDFLKWSAAGLGAAAGLALIPRRAASAPFGEFPASSAGHMLPAALQAKNVLEVFLYGGLSAWETLYLVEEYGQPTDPDYPSTQFYAFGGTGSDSVRAALTACGVPSTDPLVRPFGVDAAGAAVKLGPFARPLWDRTDLSSRMRVLVNKHDLEPHEAAIPLALTGKRVGSPTLAGLGAHIQRFHNDRPTGPRQSPYSYVLATGAIPGDNIFAAVTTGAHPGTARPLRIKVDGAERLATLLSRPSAGSPTERAEYDQLLQVYVDQYKKRLRWRGEGEPLRSPHFGEMAQGAAGVANADAVAAVMDPSLFTPISSSVCGDFNDTNVPAMSLNLAAHLLTHPTEPARYVCVVDTGLIQASGGGGYDTHTENSHDQARNFRNVLESLSSIVNQPGENDPAKLNLDETLIVLNTEFGRTPWRQDGGNGRNHHPWGYVTALIGGPIGASQAGVVGAIGPDGVATSFVTPAEARIAALLAMGIYPFAPEAFFVSDVQDADGEADATASVTERVLGYAP